MEVWNDLQRHSFIPTSATKWKIMKDEKKKIKEPYEPEDTPKPPHIIDPNDRKRENPIEDKERSEGRPASTAPDKSTPHLLSEDADIDDETTV